MYWPKNLTGIIIKYKATNDQTLFNKHIYPALSALSQALINTYKAKVERDDLTTHLWLALNTYEPSLSQSSYSYFSAVGRHYFSALSKSKFKYQVAEYDSEIHDPIVNPPSFPSKSKLDTIISQIEAGSTNEKILLKAIKKIKDNDGDKREMLKELRKITGLTTKQISTILNNFRRQYTFLSKNLHLTHDELK